MNTISLPKIFLASKSPRRQMLLKACNIDFELLDINVDESFDPALEPRAVPGLLATKKAAHAVQRIESGIVLTADSVVILNGEILNKPESPDEARIYLQKLSGNTHEVITGVCLMTKDKTRTFSCSTLVHFQDLERDEIDFYIAHYQPFDKAGAYGIQEWLGHCKIDRIEGSFNNVMGLPTHMVYDELMRF